MTEVTAAATTPVFTQPTDVNTEKKLEKKPKTDLNTLIAQANTDAETPAVVADTAEVIAAPLTEDAIKA